MYIDQLLLAARQVHVVYSDQLLGAAHYVHFISNHDTPIFKKSRGLGVLHSKERKSQFAFYSTIVCAKN